MNESDKEITSLGDLFFFFFLIEGKGKTREGETSAPTLFPARTKHFI